MNSPQFSRFDFTETPLAVKIIRTVVDQIKTKEIINDK